MTKQEQTELDLLAKKYERQNAELDNMIENLTRSRSIFIIRVLFTLINIPIHWFFWGYLFPIAGGFRNDIAALFVIGEIAYLFFAGFFYSMFSWSIGDTYTDYLTDVRTKKKLMKTKSDRDEFLRFYELTKADPDFKEALLELSRRR